MKTNKKFIMKHAWVFIPALIGLIICTALDMLYPILEQQLVDDIIIKGDTSVLMGIVTGILLIGVGQMITHYIKEFGFDHTAAYLGTELRRNLFIHVQSRDTSFFDKTNTGEIMARLKEDIDKIWSAMSYIVMLLVQVAIHTVLITIAMAKINPVITIIPVVAMAYCAFMALILEKKLGKVYGDISEQNAVLNTRVEENIMGVRTVKAFARERYEIEKFGMENGKYNDFCLVETETFAKYYPYFSFVTRILPFGVLLACAYYYLQGNMTLGECVAFVAYANNVVWPMEMLGWLTNSLSEAIASKKKIEKIYQEPAFIEDKPDAVVLEKVQGDITFENVSFHKEDMHNILSDISFHLPAGKTLGIMGATGSGKSSIISLLERLYDVTDGAIKLDGVDIRDLTVKQLRSSNSLVMQDVFLFSDTISENVRIGERARVDEKRIAWACQKAGAKEFIEKMDDKYETVIGERGVGLSGGQKQRISMARAFAKESPILILDDSTSALDMETEREVQKNLQALSDRTKIIIAHRISSVKNADEIIFLDEGRIVERGTHSELLEKKGLYYETYVSQYGEPTEVCA